MAENKQDFSSFMSVLIMTIGCLTILLVANTLIIASNPDNLEITSIFVSDEAEDQSSMGQPQFENTAKEPAYIDVERDYLVIYPGEYRVLSGELEQEGNQFRTLLDKIEANKEKEYVVMLLRPRSALFARQLRALIRARGIDVGQELYEPGKPVNYRQVGTVDFGGEGGEEPEETSTTPESDVANVDEPAATSEPVAP